MRPRLTLRQRQVLAGLASGSNVKSVALALGLSAKTVEYHWHAARCRLGLRTYVEAAHWALRHRLVRNIFACLWLAASLRGLCADTPPPLPSAPMPATTSVTLVWDRSPDTNVVRYRVYWGPSQRTYTNYLETPQTSATIAGLRLPQYFAATAVSSNGLESEFGAEVGGEPVVVVQALARTNLTSGDWTQWTQWTPAVVRRAELPGSLYLKLAITNEWR